MPNTKKKVTTLAAGAPLLAGLVVAGAAPTQALSLNVNLGGNPSVSSTTTATASPTAAAHSTNIHIGPSAVPTTGTAVDGATVDANIAAALNQADIQNGNVSGLASVSAALLGQAGSAHLVTGGNVNAADVVNSGSAAGAATLGLDLSLGNTSGGIVPALPDVPNVPVPTSPTASNGGGGSAGANGRAANASGSGSGSGAVSSSATGGSAKVAGNGSGSTTTPANGGGGGIVPPTATIPCTSVNLIGDKVLVTVNGVVNTDEVANTAGSLAATVLAKPNLNTCTVALDLSVDGLVTLVSENGDLTNLISLDDLGNLNDLQTGIVDVDLDQDDPANSAVTVNVTPDSVDTDSLLSIK